MIKEILRAQWDERKGLWKIVKKTYNGSGGWKRFGYGWHFTKGDAEKTIARMVNNFPEMYEYDNSVKNCNLKPNDL